MRLVKKFKSACSRLYPDRINDTTIYKFLLHHAQQIDTIYEYSAVFTAGCEMFKVIRHRFGLLRALGYGVRQLSDFHFVFYRRSVHS